jgi:hypothetical protein
MRTSPVKGMVTEPTPQKVSFAIGKIVVRVAVVVEASAGLPYGSACGMASEVNIKAHVKKTLDRIHARRLILATPSMFMLGVMDF